jgi:hypothetical protein
MLDPDILIFIADSCRDYFATNPYDLGFKPLDRLLDGLQVSYYSRLFGACHLDLVRSRRPASGLTLPGTSDKPFSTQPATFWGRLCETPVSTS